MVLPQRPRPMHYFQDVILTLERYWAEQGCIIWQPYDVEVGAGTSNPATATSCEPAGDYAPDGSVPQVSTWVSILDRVLEADFCSREDLYRGGPVFRDRRLDRPRWLSRAGIERAVDDV